MQDEHEFRRYISAVLAEHPHWLVSANIAILEGMGQAMKAANERSAKLDLALRCALGLVEKARLDEKARALLTAPILAVLPTEGASEIERLTRDRLKEATD